MNSILSLQEVRQEDRKLVGGKAIRLAAMLRAGISVPQGLCLCGDLYRGFIETTGIQGRIHFELNRKPFEQMRWEEIWDGALRIRNLFIHTPLPASIRSRLEGPFYAAFKNRPVAVRSSGEEEDASDRSFAGLHESFVNVRGVPAILDHVKLVWASLWSDRALLYRKELGLDISTSAMPVLIQELWAGEVSGVAFSRGPGGENRIVIEAVYGLNQGLVDGAVEPDRWIVDRTDQRKTSHRAPSERKRLMPSPGGVAEAPLPPELAMRPPLDPAGLGRVVDLALRAESLFGGPQDVEWTFKGEALLALQSRPITTAREAGSCFSTNRPFSQPTWISITVSSISTRRTGKASSSSLERKHPRNGSTSPNDETHFTRSRYS